HLGRVQPLPPPGDRADRNGGAKDVRRRALAGAAQRTSYRLRKLPRARRPHRRRSRLRGALPRADGKRIELLTAPKPRDQSGWAAAIGGERTGGRPVMRASTAMSCSRSVARTTLPKLLRGTDGMTRIRSGTNSRRLLRQYS